MRFTLYGGAVLLAVVAATGCNRNETADPSEVAPEDTQTRLPDTCEIDLSAWLQKPRKELAALCDEWSANVEIQRELARKQPEAFDLMPRFYIPARVAVFQQARYLPGMGFSVPPYLEENTRDPGLALHLARFGDLEAAQKLLAPDDLPAHNKINRLKMGKNYPVEWTRLVSLAQTLAQYKLGLGDVDGAADLVHLHSQLVKLLDQDTAKGPLGAVLLAPGKRVLAQAVKSWREPRLNKSALADDIEAALKEWGETPEMLPGLALDATREDITTLMARPVTGKAVVATDKAGLARALDVLALPLPSESARTLVAFLDDKDQLAELQLAYGPRLETLYPGADHIGYHLLERNASPGEETKDPALQKQIYTTAKLKYRLWRTGRGQALGALVRIQPVDKPTSPVASRSFRDLGSLDLDRSFESTRQAFASAQTGSLLLMKDAGELGQVGKALGTPVPAQAAIQREKASDLIHTIEIAWSPDENGRALETLLPALWADHGPGTLEGVSDSLGNSLAFVWTDESTRSVLRLPFDDSPPLLLVKDIQPATKQAGRLEAALQREVRDRDQRIASGAAIMRLPRSFGVVNDFSLEGISLGMPRAEAEAALPTGKDYRRASVPGGISLTILGAPERAATYWARQILLRFKAGRVSEMRVCFEETANKGEKTKSLLETLSADRGGQPEVLPGTWAGLWNDIAKPGPVDFRRWRDDRTVRTYQRDVGGMTVTLRDRPAGKEVAIAPWTFIPHGFKGCLLGESRADVVAALKAAITKTSGADVHRGPAGSPFEMVMVWYTGDKVSRILAVHRERPPEDPVAAAAVLNRLWGKDLETLGQIRRVEGKFGSLLAAYYWHDDTVRQRISVEVTGQGPRILTEWRYWPLVEKAKPGTPDATKKQ